MASRFLDNPNPAAANRPVGRVTGPGLAAGRSGRSGKNALAGCGANQRGRRCGKHPGPWPSFLQKGTQLNATKPAPARQRKPRSKPARFIRLRLRPDGAAPGVVTIRVGPLTADSLVTQLPADYGRGLRVEKLGSPESPYCVNLDGAAKTGDCQGPARHGHCKHADGRAALVAAGRL